MVGSANTDLVISVERAPAAGETVLGGELARHHGGKGLNQAVAAARWGAATAFLGAVGDDADGRAVLALLDNEGIDTGPTRTVSHATGTALILLEPGGQNRIVVAPGANAELVGLSAADRSTLGRAGVVLAQLEVPLETVAEALRVARAGGALTILNAAPARPLPTGLTDLVELLVVNETEAFAVAGVEPTGSGDLPVAALLRLVPEVVITLGAAGCRYGSRAGVDLRLPATEVAVLDTTGAGDTFAGVLAAELAARSPIADALARAVHAAGLSVQAAGAVSSIPHRSQYQ